MGTFDSRDNAYQPITDAKALVPITRAALANAHRIKVAGIPIGYLQNWTENQNRPANPQYEIGSTGIIEHVPAQPTYTLSATKLAIYRINFNKVMQELGIQKKNPLLYEAIKARLGGDGIINFSLLVSAAIPFDIEAAESDPVDTTGENSSSEAVFTTTWIDCLITSSSKTMNSNDNLTIVESLNLVARKPQFSSTAPIAFPPSG